MCGGAQDAYAGVEPVIAAYARMCKLLGPAGSGHRLSGKTLIFLIDLLDVR